MIDFLEKSATINCSSFCFRQNSPYLLNVLHIFNIIHPSMLEIRQTDTRKGCPYEEIYLGENKGATKDHHVNLYIQSEKAVYRWTKYSEFICKTSVILEWLSIQCWLFCQASKKKSAIPPHQLASCNCPELYLLSTENSIYLICLLPKSYLQITEKFSVNNKHFTVHNQYSSFLQILQLFTRISTKYEASWILCEHSWHIR